MNITSILREQHTELLNVMSQIYAHLNAEELSQDANEIKILLASLFGKLNVHLSMEDKSLYPHLINHSNEEIKKTSKEYMDEMGGLAKDIEKYKAKWPHAKAIQENPEEFIENTKNILTNLNKRIDLEDNNLYKLMDELDNKK